MWSSDLKPQFELEPIEIVLRQLYYAENACKAIAPREEAVRIPTLAVENVTPGFLAERWVWCWKLCQRTNSTIASPHSPTGWRVFPATS